MELSYVFGTHLEPLTAAEIEQARASTEQMQQDYEAWRESAREEAGRQFAKVSPEEWGEMHPLLKGFSIQAGVGAYNRDTNARKLERNLI